MATIDLEAGRQLYAAEQECPAEIRDTLRRIEVAAGKNLASNDRPCGLTVCYVAGSETPWRLADDWGSVEYATAEAAAEAAEDWYD